GEAGGTGPGGRVGPGMIEVTGSKTQPKDPDAAQRYVLKNAEKKSATPAVLLMLLMGVAVYLKSIFPGQAAAEEDPANSIGSGKAGPDQTELDAMAPNTPASSEERRVGEECRRLWRMERQ